VAKNPDRDEARSLCKSRHRVYTCLWTRIQGTFDGPVLVTIATRGVLLRSSPPRASASEAEAEMPEVRFRSPVDLLVVSSPCSSSSDGQANNEQGTRSIRNPHGGIQLCSAHYDSLRCSLFDRLAGFLSEY
jgi:hypothetical protein